MTGTIAHMSVRTVDRSLWMQMGQVARVKGSPGYACLNWALRDWLSVHGTLIYAKGN